MVRGLLPADIAIGQVFLSKYRVDAIIGHGGMGVVAECTHLALNERVAIKMLRKDVLLDHDAVQRFVRKGGQTLSIQLVETDHAIVIDRGATRRKTAFITAGAGLALLATSGIIGLIAHDRYRNCVDGNDPKGSDAGKTSCPVASTADAITYDNDQWHLARYWGTSFFVAGAAAVGVATYLYLTAPRKERIDRTVWIPTVSHDQIGVALAGGF